MAKTTIAIGDIIIRRRSIGKTIREFKSAGKEIQQEVTEAIDGDSDSTKPTNKAT